MEAAEYNRMGEALQTALRLNTHPIAVKFCERLEDVPENAVFPKKDLGKHISFCQCTALTRFRGMTVAMTKEDHWCWNPLIALGCVECVPGQPTFTEVIKILGIKDPDKAAAFFTEFPRLPLDKYKAVVTTPLTKCTFEPDVAVIYSNTAQMNVIIRAIKGMTGECLKSFFDGIDSCVYATIVPLLSGEYQLTFPDPGDRERARAGDDEVILSVPAAKLPELAEQFKTPRFGMTYSNDLLELPLEYPLPHFYAKLFDMWGLESTPSK
ncbi:MAG: DUF169 domain-containing protein [Clostridiales bacterium]|nr:DUF169 domain-containing protein [Clostridiales bacterium]